MLFGIVRGSVDGWVYLMGLVIVEGKWQLWGEFWTSIVTMKTLLHSCARAMRSSQMTLGGHVVVVVVVVSGSSWSEFCSCFSSV